ncbi:MAG: 1-(5-phosphoribosyl)-5-[(5-phosphoribosylamino)methylideneamino]imidazole-4-carboxamide isomerase [Chloroflexota bacterium]|nr:1-(5-phosphoribosyl)-5-[(5-phosphoribosylamino)methylideneamino]imidazole-4-carboxamide isomerase [Chloroflexota bacterium]
MDVIPAIDLRGGRCVRLYQGDYDQEEVYGTDPVAVALRWQEEGASLIHVVDLDGAASGEPANMDAIRAIVAAASVPVEVGGGIRDLETAEAVAETGATRLVLGTSAVEDPDFVSAALARFGPGMVAVSVDARDGWAALRGWKQPSRMRALDLMRQMTGLGVECLEYTDISRDGTLTEPNFEAVTEAVSNVTTPIIAAGGIASLRHLERLAGLGVSGAIVGKALYTGAVGLPEAIRLVGGAHAPR